MVSTGGSDLADFKSWLETKEYAKSYIQSVLPYAKKYNHILDDGNLRDLDLLSNHKKAHAVKALTLLSKFRGNYTEFKAKLAEHGFKWERSNGLRAFLRIFNATNNEVMKWYNEARGHLRENEAFDQGIISLITGTPYCRHGTFLTIISLFSVYFHDSDLHSSINIYKIILNQASSGTAPV